jgi:HEAT repeat protein
VSGCLDLLAGREVDGNLVVGLGGPPARWAVDGGEAGPDYWLRVWALRGLLWLWDDAAAEPVVASLADEAWRVREMAAKVAARHRVEAALPSLSSLQHDDGVARVRQAAERAVIRLTGAGQ